MEPTSPSRTGSETRQKQRRITFRMTEEEYAVLEIAAAKAGISIGGYIRERVLAAPVTRSVRRPTVERAMLAQALALLGRTSGSLHQIAKHLNFGGTDSAGLPEAITEVKAAGASIMAALGRRAAR